MTPQIRPMRDALVVDLDNAVRTGELVALRQFDDAVMIFRDPELRAARQHSVALDTRYNLHAQRHICGCDPCATVRRAANYRALTVAARIDRRFDVLLP